MSDYRNTPPHPSMSTVEPAEDFGVELDWPSDELTAPPGAFDALGPPHSDAAEAPPSEDDRTSPDPGAEEEAASSAVAAESEDPDRPLVEGVGGALADAEDEPWPEVRLGPPFDSSPAHDHDDDLSSPEGGLEEDDAPRSSEPAAGTVSASLVTQPVWPAGLRPEALHGALSTLALRVEALVGATSTNRTSVTERLNDHIDTVGRIARSQMADLAEFQQTNERALSDVRRVLQGSDDLLHGLTERLGELRADVVALQRQLDEVREGQDRLAKVIELVPAETAPSADTVEQFDAIRAELATFAERQIDAHQELARHVERLSGALEALSEVPDEPLTDGPSAVEIALGDLATRVEELAAIATEGSALEAIGRIEGLVRAPRDGRVLEVLHDLERAVEAPRDGRVLATLRQVDERVRELHELEAARPEPPADPWAGGPEVAERLARVEELLVAAAEERLAGESSVPPEALELDDLRLAIDALRAELPSLRNDDDGEALAAVRDELAGLRRTLAAAVVEPPEPEPAAPDPAVAVQLAAVTHELTALRRRISVRAKPAAVAFEPEQADALADLVAEAVLTRLREVLEVVPADEAGS